MNFDYYNQQAQNSLSGLAGLANSQSFGSTFTTEKTPQVKGALEQLGKEIAFQQEQISILFSRLEGAMSLEAQGKESGAISKNEPTCPIAATITHYTADLAGLTSVVSQILRRLEI